MTADAKLIAVEQSQRLMATVMSIIGTSLTNMNEELMNEDMCEDCNESGCERNRQFYFKTIKIAPDDYREVTCKCECHMEDFSGQDD